MNPKIFNPMAYLRHIRRQFRYMRRLFRILNDPPPLNNYPDYDEYWIRRHANGKNPGLLHRYKAIAELLPAGASVLDIGCGDGSFGQHLRDSRPDCSYLGADISAAAISIAHQRNLSGIVIDPSKKLTEQIDGVFDVVTAMEVIEHVHDAEELMHGITSLSSNQVVITIPNSGYVLHRIRLAVFGRFPVTTIVFHIKEHIRFWTYRDFADWSAVFGLKIKRFIGQEGNVPFAERLLARHFPSLFAAQVIFVLEKSAPSSTAKSRS